jgi:hypothetical protein
MLISPPGLDFGMNESIQSSKGFEEISLGLGIHGFMVYAPEA